MSAPDRPPAPRPLRRGATTFRAGAGSKLGAVGLVLLLLGLGVAEGAPAPVRTSTPEGAFDTFKKAADRDVKAMAAIMAPELLDRTTEKLIESVAPLAALVEAFGGDGLKQVRPLFDALARHGVTEVDLKNAKGNNAAVKALAARVKDKPRLLADLVEAGNRLRKDDAATRKREQEDRENALAAKLKDLRVTGDTASAKVVSRKRDRSGRMVEKEEPIRFRRVGGTWRISEIPFN
jgi:hypothetical protein